MRMTLTVPTSMNNALASINERMTVATLKTAKQEEITATIAVLANVNNKSNDAIANCVYALYLNNNELKNKELVELTGLSKAYISECVKGAKTFEALKNYKALSSMDFLDCPIKKALILSKYTDKITDETAETVRYYIDNSNVEKFKNAMADLFPEETEETEGTEETTEENTEGTEETTEETEETTETPAETIERLLYEIEILKAKNANLEGDIEIYKKALKEIHDNPWNYANIVYNDMIR